MISYSKIVLARRTNIGRHTMGAKSEKKMYNLKRQSGLRSEEFFLKNVDFNINFSILALYGHIRCTLSRDI